MQAARSLSLVLSLVLFGAQGIFAAPTLVSAGRNLSDLTIRVAFSEPIGVNPANFSIAGAKVVSATFGNTANVAVLTVTGLKEGQPFTLTVNGIKGLFNGAPLSGPNQIPILMFPTREEDNSAGVHLIVTEAENFERNFSPVAGHSWVIPTEATGTGVFSGAFMAALPNTGAVAGDPPQGSAPRLDYRINFKTNGVYYLWVRGDGPTGSDNSAYGGIDGVVGAQAKAIGNGNNQPQSATWGDNIWKWVNDSTATPTRVTIPRPGIHTLNIWMREDGVMVDKILLTTDPKFTFADRTVLGPSETPLSDAPAIANAKIVINKQPASVTADENSMVTFSVDAKVLSGAIALAASDIFFQWEKNGVDIVGANGPSLTLTATPGDNGAKFRVRIFVPGTSVESEEASLKVITDIVPPSVVSVSGSPTLMQVTVAFSEPVNPTTAVNPANYSLSGGLTVTGVKISEDMRRVNLATSAQTPGTVYALTVTGVKDLAAAPNTITPATVKFTAWVLAPGFLFTEVFNNIGGTAISDLTSKPKFINDFPDSTLYVSSFTYGTGGSFGTPNVDNYGARLSGFFIPSSNGVYRFYIRSDDASQLFMNTNSVNSTDPAGKVLIAKEDTCCKGFGDKAAGGPRVSPDISLVKGQKYYVEGLLKEGGGADYIQVAVREQADKSTPPNSESIPGSMLATFANPDGATITILQQPVSANVILLGLPNENQTETFSVKAVASTASGPQPIKFQWQKNAQDIPGANRATFTTPPVTLADDGSTFRVVLSIPTKTVASDLVFLSVSPDTNAPAVISARTLLRPNTITVTFNRPLLPSTAANIANFSLNNGAKVIAANLIAPNTVELTTSALSSASGSFVLTVNGVKDIAGVAVPSTQITVDTGTLPADFGQLVAGFEDDFSGKSLDARWLPTGTSLNIYSVSDGVLHVDSASGDPNHLLLNIPGYDPVTQEVLARIRITDFGVKDNDFLRAGVGVGVDPGNSQGINFHFRNHDQDGISGHQVKLLDDNRAWGPGYDFRPQGDSRKWENNTWYWMRLRQAPNSVGKQDVFAKIWLADGSTAEPSDWNVTWDYTPGRSTRQGLAGIAAGSGGVLAKFDVDYILIKAAGLPLISPRSPALPTVTMPTVGVDVNKPGKPGSFTTNDAIAGSFTVIGGGNDIWSASDQFFFAFQDVTGDFDVRVRVESLEPISKWSKAGIMARETLEGNSRMAFNRVTPTGKITGSTDTGANDSRFAYRTGITSGKQGEHEDGKGAPNYPNAWLRLRRTGDVIRAYRGTNGMDWVLQGTQDTATWEGGALPATLHLGLAVTSHDNAKTAKAEFRQFGITPQSPVTIVVQPSDVTAVENLVATFSVTVAGNDPITFQWKKNGKVIAGATNQTYSTMVTLADNGAKFSVVASNFANGAPVSVESNAATLTVTPDVTPPTVVTALTRGNPNGVTVNFSEPIAPASVVASNFSIDNGATVTAAVLGPDKQSVVLTTSTLNEGTAFTLSVKGVTDIAAKPNMISPNPTKILISFAQGVIEHRFFQFNKLGSVKEFTNSTRFPNDPNFISYLTALEFPPDGGNEAGDNYGNMILGFVHPPVTGDYIFYVNSDDQSVLFLSTDDTAANKKQIAFEPQWNNPRQWLATDRRNAKAPENKSAPITLQAGKKYYIEVVHQEGGGGDNVGVAWQLPGANPPANGTPPISGVFLSTLTPSGPVAITSQPKNVTVNEGQSASFSVAVSGTPPIRFQWFANGKPIDGATKTSLDIAVALPKANGGTVFTVTASNDFSSATSTGAKLTVARDTTAPTVVAARSFTRPNTVFVLFSKPISAATVTNLANFSIDQGVTVKSATLRSPTVVELTTSTLFRGATFKLTVSGIQDLAETPNTIAKTTVVIDQTPAQPVDFGKTVNGFQDDFVGPLNPNWVPVGKTTNIYTVANGVLHVAGPAAGDPNHLIFKAAGINSSTQEVLIRIRVTDFAAKDDDGPRGGAAVAVDATSSQGINFHFRNHDQDGIKGRQVKLLDDGRAWGPGLDRKWKNNTWYWMRLRQEPNTAAGKPDVFAKFWLADGTEPEPADWQLTWDYAPGKSVRTGFPGIAATSNNGLAAFDVDYILIKADGLPSITVTRPPFARIDSAETIANRPVTISTSKLLANDVDPLGGTLTVTGVSSTSERGGTVVLQGGNVTYTPATDFIGIDTFTYTISNSQSLTATGTVIVKVNPANAPSLNFTGIQLQPTGSRMLHFAGIPGRTYRIEVSVDLVTWSPLGTVIIGTTGEGTFEDKDTSGTNQRFYRTVSP